MASFRSVTPPAPSTITVQGIELMALALKPTPNHTPSGPVSVMVALGLAWSRPSESSTRLFSAPSSAVRPRPQRAGEAGGVWVLNEAVSRRAPAATAKL